MQGGGGGGRTSRLTPSFPRSYRRISPNQARTDRGAENARTAASRVRAKSRGYTITRLPAPSNGTLRPWCSAHKAGTAPITPVSQILFVYVSVSVPRMRGHGGRAHRHRRRHRRQC